MVKFHEDKIWEKQAVNDELSEDNPEIKREIKVCAVMKNEDVIVSLSEKISSWCKVKRSLRCNHNHYICVALQDDPIPESSKDILGFCLWKIHK